MFVFQKRLEEKDMGGGVILTELGSGGNMTVLHWNMAAGSTVPSHAHPQEQFGYVIKGGFKMVIGDAAAELKQGDCYFIPSNISHEFTAIGDTEAIDVFSPVRTDFPWRKT
jgi:quercetin dioxygenase-like cupin family protein